MRARSGLAAGLSALAAMTALAALAASLSLNGGSTTELASAKPAPKHALTQADKTRLYKSMMLQTFTSPQEARKIAGELGVPESEIPVQQLQQSSPSHHAKEEPMTPLEQKAAATRSHHSYTLHGLNVPYFSRSLHYQPPEGGSGMHAASAAYKKKLERQGIVDDNGHYLSAQQDKALSEELQGAIDTYASDELSDPTAPPSEGAPLTSRGDRVLAQQLNDGMAYAFLPNSGRAQQRPKILQGSARQELVHELVEGERDALIGEGAPAAPRTLGQRSAQQLVQALESGQRYADLPNFGRPVPRRAYEQGAQAVRREQQLVRDLTAGIPIPDAPCPTPGEPVLFHQHCQPERHKGWDAELYAGAYRKVSTGYCPTSDCSVGDCGLRAKDLSSLDIPENTRVTLYTRADFKGESLTLKGPMSPQQSCLTKFRLAEGETWNDVALSVKIEELGSKK